MKSGWQNMMINRICRSLYVRCADVKQVRKEGGCWRAL